MDLIIGGMCQGKRQYVWDIYGIPWERMLSGEEISLDGGTDESFSAECLYDFHVLVRRLLEENRDTESWMEDFLGKAGFRVIITDEIGSGIVPADTFDRRWREETGRLSCILAKKAERVIRVTCGIGLQIK